MSTITRNTLTIPITRDVPDDVPDELNDGTVIVLLEWTMALMQDSGGYHAPSATHHRLRHRPDRRGQWCERVTSPLQQSCSSVSQQAQPRVRLAMTSALQPQRLTRISIALSGACLLALPSFSWFGQRAQMRRTLVLSGGTEVPTLIIKSVPRGLMTTAWLSHTVAAPAVLNAGETGRGQADG